MGGRIMASTINSSTSNGIVITPDTSGEIELQANGVTKAKITANGLQDANGNSLRGGSFRNLIINGDMQIAQRGTSSTTANGYYTVDRINSDFDGVAVTQTQDTDVPSGQGFSKSFKMTLTSTSSATSAFMIARQNIEAQNIRNSGWNYTSSTSYVTLSFWVKSNVTGTQYLLIRTEDGTRQSINKSFTISSANTWEKKTFTIPGNSNITIDNNNGNGFSVFFTAMYNTDFTDNITSNLDAWGTFNASGYTPDNSNAATFLNTASAYMQWTGLQLEVGSGASDFEHLPYDVQLARCQRYYEVMASGYLMLALARTSDYIRRVGYQYKVTKRANPTITITSQTPDGASTIGAYSPTTDNVDFNTSGGASAIPRVNAFTMDSEL